MMISLMLAINHLPKEYEQRRAVAIKELVGNIQIKEDGAYYPYKDKYLPYLMHDQQTWFDFQWLKLLLEGRI